MGDPHENIWIGYFRQLSQDLGQISRAEFRCSAGAA
jgi:hypothetical protein